MMLKEGVSIAGIHPEIVLALLIVERVFVNLGQEFLITSVLDGVHMRGSLHYVGAAVDVRLPTSDLDDIIDGLHSGLGSDYDVVLESDHIHIGFQPKIGA